MIDKIPIKFIRPWMKYAYRPNKIRIVEKTPANCFRIRFLKKIFPDAKFIFLVRRGEDVVSSLMEGWKFWSNLQGKEWKYGNWHYIVPPNWQTMTDKSLQEICAFQWTQSNLTAWNTLNDACRDQFTIIRHEDLMAE